MKRIIFSHYEWDARFLCAVIVTDPPVSTDSTYEYQFPVMGKMYLANTRYCILIHFWVSVLYLDTFLGKVLYLYLIENFRKVSSWYFLRVLPTTLAFANFTLLTSMCLRSYFGLKWKPIMPRFIQRLSVLYFWYRSFEPCMTFLILKPMFFNNTCTKSNLRIVSMQKYVSKMYRL